MDFLEKLNLLMETNKLNKHSLAKECGIPYTTIDAFYKKGYENAKLSTIKKLAHYFNTTIDYLMREEVEDVSYGLDTNPNVIIDNDTSHLLESYHSLNEEGQHKLLDYADDLVSCKKYKKMYKACVGEQ